MDNFQYQIGIHYLILSRTSAISPSGLFISIDLDTIIFPFLT